MTAPPANAPRAGSFWHRLRTRLLPEMPDFHGLLVEQCRTTVEGTVALIAYLGDAGTDTAAEVLRLEHDGDLWKAHNLEVLHRSFSTPMDREDFYRAVEAIDDILNYAKATVREIEAFDLEPDAHMARMAEGILAGAQELLEACRLLKTEAMAAEPHARAARKSERKVEAAYRDALAELFDASHLLAAVRAREDGPDPAEGALPGVLGEVLKRREIYRHLSNAADRVAGAGQILGDIIAKAT